MFANMYIDLFAYKKINQTFCSYLPWSALLYGEWSIATKPVRVWYTLINIGSSVSLDTKSEYMEEQLMDWENG